jgi:hypothetical protein
MSFTEIVDDIQTLPLDDKLELKILLEKYIIEERREEIYQNHLIAQEMAKKGELKFSHNTDELMKILE